MAANKLIQTLHLFFFFLLFEIIDATRVLEMRS